MKREPWDIFVDVLTLLAVLTGLAAAIVTAVTVNNAGTVQRYCVSDPLYQGLLSVNSDDDRLSYFIEYNTDIGLVTNVFVMGPVDVITETGPIFIPLCGTSSSLSCDLSVGGQLDDSVLKLNPGALALGPHLAELRKNLFKYQFVLENATESYQSRLVSCGDE